jgi:hypothetical protein
MTYHLYLGVLSYEAPKIGGQTEQINKALQEFFP